LQFRSPDEVADKGLPAPPKFELARTKDCLQFRSLGKGLPAVPKPWQRTVDNFYLTRIQMYPRIKSGERIPSIPLSSLIFIVILSAAKDLISHSERSEESLSCHPEAELVEVEESL